MTSAYINTEAELGLIGCILTGGSDVASDAASSIPVSALVSDEARETIGLVSAMLDAGLPVDLTTMGSEWRTRKKGPAPVAYWSQAMESCPSPGILAQCVAQILDASHRRQLRQAADTLARESGDPTNPLDAVLANLEAGIGIQADLQPRGTAAKETATRFIDHVQARMQSKGQLWGIPTGFPRLDNMTDGLQPGEVAIVGARPSIGKTAFALNVASHACLDNQVPTLIVTAEMSEDALHRRLAGNLAGVSLHRIRRGELSEGELMRLSNANARIARSNLRFLDVSAGASVSTITAGIRRETRKHGIRLVIVDYLQKIRPSERNEKRTYEVGDVSEKLKACAKATGTALMCLAQVSRESEKEKGRLPRLADLSDSSQIEKDADLVCLIHRERTEAKGEGSLTIAKQRDGECGFIKLWYEGQFCRFTELEEEKERPI